MAAYDYDYFEQQYASRLSQPETKEEKEMKKVKKNKKQSPLQINPGLRVMMLSFVLIAVFFTMGALNVYGYSRINDINRTYSEKQEEYNTNLSRIRELDARLNALASPEKIEKTAIEKLGLVKLDDSDWQYISINENNDVIISDGHRN